VAGRGDGRPLSRFVARRIVTEGAAVPARAPDGRSFACGEADEISTLNSGDAGVKQVPVPGCDSDPSWTSGRRQIGGRTHARRVVIPATKQARGGARVETRLQHDGLTAIEWQVVGLLVQSLTVEEVPARP
jgi:hypothetical protein